MATIKHSRTLALQAAIPRTTGVSGARGVVQVKSWTVFPVWDDTQAIGAISASGYGSPINGDSVTLRSITDDTWSESRYYDSGLGWLPLPNYASYLEGKKSNEFTQADPAHAYKLTGGSLTGSATATFTGTKPGASNSNGWLTLTIDGTDFLLPIWSL